MPRATSSWISPCADAARVTLPWLAMHGVHAVVGTTGLDDADSTPSATRSATDRRTA